MRSAKTFILDPVSHRLRDRNLWPILGRHGPCAQDPRRTCRWPTEDYPLSRPAVLCLNTQEPPDNLPRLQELYFNYAQSQARGKKHQVGPVRLFLAKPLCGWITFTDAKRPDTFKRT